MILDDIKQLISENIWDTTKSVGYGVIGGAGNMDNAANAYVGQRLAAGGQQMSAQDLTNMQMQRARRGFGAGLLGAGLGLGAGLLLGGGAINPARTAMLGASLGGAAGSFIGRNSADNSYVNNKLTGAV